MGSDHYSGPEYENGATAITSKVSLSVQFLVKRELIRPGMKIVDWGSGRHGRNAEYLRSLGCSVYAYDPFHGTSNGWDGTSKFPPGDIHFDVGLSVFVLNVVTKATQNKILKSIKAGISYHVVRDDIVSIANRALSGKGRNKYITDFFYDHFSDPAHQLMDFCTFGFPTGPNKF